MSGIDHQLPRDDYRRKGFIKVADKEYFIEQGVEGTKVSIVEEDELVFLHLLKHRPGDSFLNTYTYSYEESNSGLIHDGSVLFELYWDYIYMVDIISGDLVDIIDLKDLDMRLQRDFYFGENYFHFRALAGVDTGYKRLDRNTGQIDTLVEDGFVVEQKRYWISADKTALMYHDLQLNQVVQHPYQFDNLESIQKHDYHDNSKLILIDQNGIHYLRNNDQIHSLECSIPANAELRFASDERLAYDIYDGQQVFFAVLDLESCSEINIQYIDVVFSPYWQSYVFTDETLFKDYFIFGNPNDWQGDGTFYLYDIKNNQAALLEFSIDFPFINSSVRYEDHLYILSSNHLHHIGALPELYRINLNNAEVERISEKNIYETYSITIGENQNDQQLNVHYVYDDSASLMQIDNGNESLYSVEEIDLYKNHGIYYSIYQDLWKNETYFFNTSSGVYCLKDDVTTKLFDIKSNTATSALNTKGNFIYLMAAADSSHYVFKINSTDLSFTKTELPEIQLIHFNKNKTDNAILNISSGGSSNSTGFYDLDIESFVSFENLGLPYGRLEAVSGNNVLFYAFSSGQKVWYLINTLSHSVSELSSLQDVSPSIYSDGNGGFYLNRYENDTGTYFARLNQQGNLSLLFPDYETNDISNGKNFDGQIKSLAFNRGDHVEILSFKNGLSKLKQIPLIDSSLSSFYWFESDDISFVEVNEGIGNSIYTFSFEDEPQKITSIPREDNLIAVLAGDTVNVLVFENEDHFLSFEAFDEFNNALEFQTGFQTIRNYALDDYYNIDGVDYLLSLHDGVQGEEPWIYNLSEGSLNLLKDMKEGIGSSRIGDFTRNPINQEIYFSAIKTEGDRQLFKIDDQLISTEELTDQEYYSLKIYPNPTSKSIVCEENFRHLYILSMDGKVLSQFEDYPKGKALDVQHLNNGMFVLMGLNDQNELKAGKFILTK